MKSTTITFFAFFLLSAFISLLPSTTLADVVCDMDGEPLQNGGAYYLLATITARGGVGLARTGNETCPLTVAQDLNELSEGLPVKIASPNRIAIITEHTRLDLSFLAVFLCAPTPSKWTVVDGLPEGPSVKITGYENTVDGWFFIKKSSVGYKLIFCPIPSGICSDVGLYFGNESRNAPLVLTHHDRPATFFFKKATSSSA